MLMSLHFIDQYLKDDNYNNIAFGQEYSQH